MNLRTNKSIRFGIKAAAGLLLVIGLTTPVFAQAKLKSVAVAVNDLGNPFFVQVVHGARDKAKEINPNVKVASESSNYDVNNQTNQLDNFIASGANLMPLRCFLWVVLRLGHGWDS